jgi:NADH dehydrogenase FAD-containing subunit
MTASVPVPRIVIVGCGFGGLEAARSLRAADAGPAATGRSSS